MKRSTNTYMFLFFYLFAEKSYEYDSDYSGILVDLSGLLSSEISFVGNIFGDLKKQTEGMNRAFISKLDLGWNPQLTE